MRTHTLADLPGVPERFGRLFWQRVPMARLGPDVHFAVSREIEEPYRTGRCIVLHLEPFRPGLCIGWYSRATVDPDDENAVARALRRAVTVREPTQGELDDFDDERRLHGPGRPGGLRFSASRGIEARGGRPRPGVGAAGNAGAE